MLDLLIDLAVETGAIIFRFLPRSFRRQIDPDSTLGQALGIVFGIVFMIAAMLLIDRIYES